jgi:DNA-binding beta-propeller fold protein YncE
MSYPRGIDVAADGQVAVADKTGRIQIFSPNGALVTQWTMPKMDNGTPTGLIFDASDPSTISLLVADTHNSRILRYDLRGRLLNMFGEYGEAPGQMIYPTDIALDGEGNMYISEYGLTDRVMVFDRGGNFKRQWGGFGEEAGKFQRPMALAMDPAGRIIVADSCNHRLQVFNMDGELLAVWGGVGSEAGQFNYPYDVATDEDGRVYVAEYGNHRVQVFSAEGEPLAQWGTVGAASGQLNSPWGVAVGPGAEEVWIADTYNHRLQVVGLDRFLASGHGPSGPGGPSGRSGRT